MIRLTTGRPAASARWNEQNNQQRIQSRPEFARDDDLTRLNCRPNLPGVGWLRGVTTVCRGRRQGSMSECDQSIRRLKLRETA